MRDMIDYANNYLVIPFEKWQVKYRRKKVIELLNKYKHDSLLEIGCGMEPIFLYYSQFQEFTVVEPSDLFYNNATEKVDENNLRDKVFLTKGTLEENIDLLKQKQYDHIIVSSLLHEVEKPFDFMLGVKKLCSANTMLHINVPNAKSLHRLVAFEAGMISDIYERSEQQKKMQQNSTFDIDSLSKFVADLGFIVVERGGYFPKLFTHSQMAKMLQYEIIDEKILDGIYGLGKYLPDFGSEVYVECKVKNAEDEKSFGFS